jgi:hypothetical protein
MPLPEHDHPMMEGIDFPGHAFMLTGIVTVQDIVKRHGRARTYLVTIRI